MGISLKTHKFLWGASGNLCARCERRVVEDATETDDPSIVGEEAHIVSSKPDGPRFDDPLPTDRRDLAENLLILCNGCHKIVDDQVGKYTVAYLRQMKSDHAKKISDRVCDGDAQKKRDDLLYAEYVDGWAERAGLDRWENWSYGMLSGAQPKLFVVHGEQLDELTTWLLGRVWPGRYPLLEDAFGNFRTVLQDLLKTFYREATEVGDLECKMYLTRSFDPVDWLEQAEFASGLKRHEAHVAMVQDLAIELTRAANYVCDRVRQFISPTYRLKEGRLLATAGVFMDMTEKTFVAQYTGDERVEVPYPGLEDFRSVRLTRDFYFGRADETR